MRERERERERICRLRGTMDRRIHEVTSVDPGSRRRGSDAHGAGDRGPEGEVDVPGEHDYQSLVDVCALVRRKTIHDL